MEPGFKFLDKLFILTVSILALFMVAMGIFGNNGIITYMELKRGYNEMQQRIDVIESENEKLTAEIDLLRTDAEYIERIAREELGMVRPGEVLYRFRRDGGEQ